VCFLAVHILTAVTDSFVTITWVNAFVPFTGTYRPIWLGLGAVASDLLIALIITSLLRRQIGYRVWRAVHWAAYGCWPIALVHGLGTGTDASHGWALWTMLGCLAAVSGATWWRLATVGRDPVANEPSVAGRTAGADRRAPAVAASVVVPQAILAWLAVGPLRPGWAARAGTPTSASTVTTGAAAAAGAGSPASPSTAAAASVVPSTTAGAASAASFAKPFTATLTGTVAETAADASGNTTVTISAVMAGPVTGQLEVTLVGAAQPSGGVTMTSSHATLGPSGQPTLYRGEVVSLAGTRLVLRLTGATATPTYATVDLTLGAAGNCTGTIRTSATAPG
jgi:hypothetical protein